MCEFNSFERAKACYKTKIVQGSSEKLTLTKVIACTKTALLSKTILILREKMLQKLIQYKEMHRTNRKLKPGCLC